MSMQAIRVSDVIDETRVSNSVPPNYKCTEVGVIPQDWSVAQIRDFAETSSGATPARSRHERYFANGHIPWVKTMDLNNSQIDKTDEAITLAAIEECSLQVYPKDSVLVAMYGGFKQIGRTGLLTFPATINQAITAIVPNPEVVLPGYLIRCLNFRVECWKSVASSSRKDPNITGKEVREFQIPLPPTVEEQEAIVDALSNADDLIVSVP